MVGSARICAICLSLKILQTHSDIEAEIVEEQVQRVAGRERCRRRATCRSIGLRRGKLPGGGSCLDSYRG